VPPLLILGAQGWIAAAFNPELAHAELVEAPTECGTCLDKLGMSGSVL